MKTTTQISGTSASPRELNPEQALLLEEQRLRAEDPATYSAAQARMDAVKEPLNLIAGRVATQTRAAYTAPQPRQKIHWIRQAISTFTAVVEPMTGCKHGCSSCCYQSVHVTDLEARVIAKETGAEMAPYVPPNDDRVRFLGVSCVFLQNGKCSIYASRPVACRLLLNMDKDDLLCRNISGPEHMMLVPYFPVNDYHREYLGVQTAGMKRSGSTLEQVRAEYEKRLKLADIRNYFPNGLAKPAQTAAP